MCVCVRALSACTIAHMRRRRRLDEFVLVIAQVRGHQHTDGRTGCAHLFESACAERIQYTRRPSNNNPIPASIEPADRNSNMTRKRSFACTDRTTKTKTRYKRLCVRRLERGRRERFLRNFEITTSAPWWWYHRRCKKAFSAPPCDSLIACTRRTNVKRKYLHGYTTHTLTPNGQRYPRCDVV